MKITMILMAALVAGAGVVLRAEDQPLMGKLGHPVGTRLTIEGIFKGGKNHWVEVARVNGKDLPSLVTVSTTYLTDVSNTPRNSPCKFRGIEVTYVVEPVTDPKTGAEMQQAAAGRHFDFKVMEILPVEDAKAGQDKSPNKPSEATR